MEKFYIKKYYTSFKLNFDAIGRRFKWVRSLLSLISVSKLKLFIFSFTVL